MSVVVKGQAFLLEIANGSEAASRKVIQGGRDARATELLVQENRSVVILSATQL